MTRADRDLIMDEYQRTKGRTAARLRLGASPTTSQYLPKRPAAGAHAGQAFTAGGCPQIATVDAELEVGR